MNEAHSTNHTALALHRPTDSMLSLQEQPRLCSLPTEYVAEAVEDECDDGADLVLYEDHAMVPFDAGFDRWSDLAVRGTVVSGSLPSLTLCWPG
jgi:hypothetical protein